MGGKRFLLSISKKALTFFLAILSPKPRQMDSYMIWLLSISFIIYLQCLLERHARDLQKQVHMADFWDLWRIFADSLSQWIPQVLTAEQHTQDSQCQTSPASLEFTEDKYQSRNAVREVSNVGLVCELDAKLLSPRDVKGISSGPMRWEDPCRTRPVIFSLLILHSAWAQQNSGAAHLEQFSWELRQIAAEQPFSFIPKLAMLMKLPLWV